MKPLFLILALLLPGQIAFAEKSLPKISAKSMERIQRLFLVLSITEYPQPQGVVMKYPALLPHKDLGGVGGSDMEDHEIIALTDTKDPIGYYGVNIYFGDREPAKDHISLIARMEIFFQPAYSEKFFTPLGQLIFKPERSSHTIEGMRELMRKLKLTPSEFVQQLDETGLPSERMIKELESLSCEKRRSDESPKQ